jgi:excisionase family DNA binding protein
MPKLNQPVISKDDHVPAGNKTLTIGEVYGSVLQEYPDVLNVPQVSAALGVSTKTVYRLLHAGDLGSLKVGREFRVPKLYVMQYIKVLGRTEHGS